MKTLECYHTTAKQNIDNILKEGFEYSKATKCHWLGKGVYFFEDLYYAVEWEIIGIIKKEIKDFEQIQKECGILVSNIDTENYTIINLSSPIGYNIFNKMLKKIKEYYTEEQYKQIKSKGYKYIIRILEKLEEIENKKYLSKYDIVCAIYPKDIYAKESNNKNGDFIICTQKQICIKNKEAIIKTEVCKNNNIKDVFTLMIDNREEYNGKRRKNSK